MRVDRAVCSLDPDATSIWEAILAFGGLELEAIGGMDFVLSLGSDRDPDHWSLAAGIMAIATLPDARVFVDALQELDRTAQRVNGLLDRLSNPTPAFHLLRAINTILFGTEARPSYRACSLEPGGSRVGLVSDADHHFLVTQADADSTLQSLQARFGFEVQVDFVDLERVESWAGETAGELAQHLDSWDGLTGLLTLRQGG